MKATFLILFSLLALLSCGGSDNKNVIQTTVIVKQDSLISYGDTSMFLKANEVSNEPTLLELDYKVILAQKDLEEIDSNCLAFVKSDYALIASLDSKSKNNTKHFVSIFESKKNSWTEVQKDTALSISNMIEPPFYKFEDMDGDGVKDILIKCEHDGRRNQSWYLFLVKNKERKFVFVEQFKTLASPKLSIKDKIIKSESFAHRETTTEFYEIKNNKLKFVKGKRVYLPNTEEEYTTKEGFDN